MSHFDDRGDTGFASEIRRMRSVSLDDVNRGAELLTRTDRKYVVSSAQLDLLSGDLADRCSVLQIGALRHFGYSTTYHDTPDRQLHRDTAHRRPMRFKVRVRDYVDSDLHMLEVKTKNARGRTVKHRIELSELAAPAPAPHGSLTPEMQRFVDSVVETPLTELLEPALRVDFDRTTLVTNDGESRCTIDLGLRAEDPGGNAVAPDLIVVETKSGNRASAIDRWLWSRGIRPTRLSKYCTSMAALDATLPANHWHRQLRTYFPARRHPDRPLAV